MEHVKYYAVYSLDLSKKEAKGVLRRRVVDGIIYDEEYTRQSRWEPTEYFELYRLGHQNDDYREVTEAEVQAVIERGEEYLRRHPDQRDVARVHPRPSDYLGRPRYEGDGLPEDW